MANVFNALVDLPIRPDEYWVAGLVRLPGWVQSDTGNPTRAWMGISMSQEMGIDASPLVGPEQKVPALVVEAFAKHAQRAQRLPAKIHVWEDVVADELRRQLQDAGIAVSVLVGPRHPVVDGLLADLAAQATSAKLPGLLTGKGVTLDQAKSFAEASRLFCQAQPWRVFDSDEDLLGLEFPTVPARMRYLAVLGRAGMEYGVGFYEKASDFFAQRAGTVGPEEVSARTVVYMSLAALHELPDPDADLWEDHGLALFDGKVMLPAIISPRAVKRPDRDMLALMEAVLRALAVSTEADLDAGAWSREVVTATGPMKIGFTNVAAPEGASGGHLSREAMEAGLAEVSRLAAEGKVKPGELISFDLNQAKRSAASPMEKAQEKIYAAWDAVGRKSILLAREALELWPDAADAYNILAREYNSPTDAKEWYLKALAAGERALGPAMFTENRGHFWGILETRPYMRALEGLAWCQWKLDDHAAAIASAQRVLELNPNDNQGMRYALICWLFFEKQDRQAAALLKQFEDDASAWWFYARALLAFRLSGDTDSARRELQRAQRANPFVPAFLTGDKSLPFVPPPSYGMGDEDEAIFCAKDMAPVWQSDPAALSWLQTHVAVRRKKKRK